MIHFVYDFRNLKMENCCICPARPSLGIVAFLEITLLAVGILAFAKVYPFGDLPVAYPIAFVATSGTLILIDAGTILLKVFKRYSLEVERKEREQSFQQLQDAMTLIAPQAPATRYHLDLKALCKSDASDVRPHLYPVYLTHEKEALVLGEQDFVLYFENDSCSLIHILIQVGLRWEPLAHGLENIRTGYYTPHNPVRPTL